MSQKSGTPNALTPIAIEPRPLRSYQEHAIELLRQSLRSGRKRPVLQLPTGAGKTRIAAEIINGALATGRQAIFVVPRISLIEQTVAAFAREGVWNVGVIQGQHFRTNPNAPVQVASAQTLVWREIPMVGLVIIDECHLRFEKISNWVVSPEWAAVPFIGLTATPWAKGMGKSYDDLIIPITITQLITDGSLSPFRVFAPPGPDLTGVRTTAGEFNEGDLSTAATKRKSSPMSSALGSKRVRTGQRFATAAIASTRSTCKSAFSRRASRQNTSIATLPCSTVRTSSTGFVQARPSLSATSPR